METIKRKNAYGFLIISLLLASGITHAEEYSTKTVTVGSDIERQLYYGDHHFGTIIDSSGTFNFRPHPGTDVNGWGSSWYLQPFLPGATLKGTTFQKFTSTSEGIHVTVVGTVSRSCCSTYGNWNASLTFTHNQDEKQIKGTGTYAINLSSSLSASTGDLNLYRIASNYLDDVPLLTGGTNDTGDMNNATVTGIGNIYPFVWNPADQPGHFPSPASTTLGIAVSGQHNIIDTAAQGLAPIEPAYKPSINITLQDTSNGPGVIFGGIYTTSQSTNFAADNVGITPLITHGNTVTAFTFSIVFISNALPDDGISDCDERSVSLPSDNSSLYCTNRTLPVQTDWNFISLPVELKNNSITHFFTLSSLRSLYSYSSSSWLFYKNASNNTISNLNANEGFWVESNGNTTILLQGRSRINDTFQFGTGSLAINYPGGTNTTPAAFFRGTNSSFHAAIENGTWKAFRKGRPSFLNTLTTLRPGQAIHVTFNGTAKWKFNGSAFIDSEYAEVRAKLPSVP